jgi:cyclin-dependent kinase 8/11
MAKIVEVLGTPEGSWALWSSRMFTDSPAVERWPDIISMPDYPQFALQSRYEYFAFSVLSLSHRQEPSTRRKPQLATWYGSRSRSEEGYKLLTQLFEFDPMKRITAAQAIEHEYFTREEPRPMRK